MTETTRTNSGHGWLLVGLFVLMAIGLVVAYLVLLEGPRQARNAAVELIRTKYGGEVETVSTCPDWLKETSFEEYFTYVVGVRVTHHEPIPQEELRYLRSLDDLEWLDLQLPEGTVGVVESLPPCEDLYSLRLVNPSSLPEPRTVPHLDTLDVLDPAWGPGDAAILAGYENVERLRLMIRDPAILEEAVAAASRLPKLSELRLEYSTVTPRALGYLERSKTLLLLDLSQSGTTLAGIEAVSRVPTLQHLELDNMTTTGDFTYHRFGVPFRVPSNVVGNDAMRHVAKLTDLRFLQLDRTDVGDEGLVHLDPINYLTYLYLEQAPVSNAGVRQIAKHQYLKRLKLSKNWYARAVIDDGAVEDLLTLTNLEALELRYTDLGKSGFARLRAGLPSARVEPHFARNSPSPAKQKQLEREAGEAVDD